MAGASATGTDCFSPSPATPTRSASETPALGAPEALTRPFPASSAGGGGSPARPGGRSMLYFCVHVELSFALWLWPKRRLMPHGSYRNARTDPTHLTLLYPWRNRSEEHTSELQSQFHLVCR